MTALPFQKLNNLEKTNGAGVVHEKMMEHFDNVSLFSKASFRSKYNCKIKMLRVDKYTSIGK